MKKLTSFTHLTTGEGDRIAFTYSELDSSGNLICQNNKGNFVAIDNELINHIRAIQTFIQKNHLEEQ